ncbi:MAG: MBOAT family protein [Leptolyngbyaceae bacterium]|nr:MBOAT family protein [Leptolyngbyaceae bacterium]
MAFLSVSYGLFLFIVLGIYWSVQEYWLRLWTVLIASLVFYASLQVQYVPLLFVIIFMNFRLGLEMGAPPDWRASSNEDWQFSQQDWNRHRLKLLYLGIALNVFLLLGFKYIPFFLDTLGASFNWMAAKSSANWLDNNLIAPLALSFFCFECIAYLIDVYRGAPATQEFLEFAAYKLFFPKLISGPITRYHPFIAQLKSPKLPTPDQVVEGLWLIACGAVKKGILADRLGIFVELCFTNLQRAGSIDLWLAILAYGLQIYLDFSGYVDIVRGSAMLLGFNLPENFDFPYFSTSIADFWRRWHITLGAWLRNYLYFPLGGSRRSLGRTCLNLLLVMVVAGIWHGAAWGFVIWGGLHGVALGIHRLTEVQSRQFPWLKFLWQSPPGVLVAWLLTQLMVFVSWVFFRLANLKESGWVVQHLWGHSADVQFAQKVYIDSLGLEPLQLGLLLWMLVGCMVAIYVASRGLKLQLNWPLKVLLVPICLFAVSLLAPKGGLPYIYFDF